MCKTLNLNAEEFKLKINDIKDALEERCFWVNDQMEIRKKDHGLFIFLKVIILPLARIFNCDPFNHIRIYHVAITIMSTYQTLEPSLDTLTKEKVSCILSLLRKRARNRSSKRYLDVFSGHLTSPIVKTSNRVINRQSSQDQNPPLHESIPESPSKLSPVMKTDEEFPSASEFIKTDNTYNEFFKTHEKIMKITDEVLSQETEMLPEDEKDKLYIRILGLKKQLRDVEGESWYASLGHLQTLMLRNQLKLAFDTLAGYKEDYVENTRREIKKSVHDFRQKYCADDVYFESDED